MEVADNSLLALVLILCGLWSKIDRIFDIGDNMWSSLELVGLFLIQMGNEPTPGLLNSIL